MSRNSPATSSSGCCCIPSFPFPPLHEAAKRHDTASEHENRRDGVNISHAFLSTILRQKEFWVGLAGHWKAGRGTTIAIIIARTAQEPTDEGSRPSHNLIEAADGKLRRPKDKAQPQESNRIIRDWAISGQRNGLQLTIIGSNASNNHLLVTVAIRKQIRDTRKGSPTAR
jgi:hypothetical protein